MTTKVINLSVNAGRQCPCHRKYGKRSAPGCSHFKFKLDAFGVKELPNHNEIDDLSRCVVGVFNGGIPDWCPLEDEKEK